MNKYNIGDILEAKEDVQLSAWSKEKCLKGQKMQVAEVNIKIYHNNKIDINYELCFPDKAPYFRMSCREEGIDYCFTKFSDGNINYCSEWLR
jgi:hypothetical protein